MAFGKAHCWNSYRGCTVVALNAGLGAPSIIRRRYTCSCGSRLAVVADRVNWSYGGSEVHRPVPRTMTSDNKAQGLYDKRDFIYLAEADAYRCPAGEQLTYRHASIEDGLNIKTYYNGQALGAHQEPARGRRLVESHGGAEPGQPPERGALPRRWSELRRLGALRSRPARPVRPCARTDPLLLRRLRSQFRHQPSLSQHCLGATNRVGL